MTLLHENRAGWAATSAYRALELLAEAGPALGLLFDVGNGVEHGYEAADLLPDLVPYVLHVHVKDAVGRPGAARYVPLGAGRARVAECLRLLRDGGYSGALSIEPHLTTHPHEGLPDGAEDGFAASGRALAGLVSGLGVPAGRR